MFLNRHNFYLLIYFIEVLFNKVSWMVLPSDKNDSHIEKIKD